jgi:3-isopropylmalate dehydratase small subunit
MHPGRCSTTASASSSPRASPTSSTTTASRTAGATVERLFAAVEASEGYTLTLDLPAQTLTTPDGEAIAFEVDAFRKHCLLEGLDDIGLTLQQVDAIREFEGRHKAANPWLFD